MDAESRIDQIEKAQAKLPSFLKRSKEQIKSDEQAQELRRASFTRAKQTDEEKVMAIGFVIEEIARANLATKGSDKRAEKIRLSQGLELQGRYGEAAEAHPHKREKTRLLKIEEAIAKPDDEFCKCKGKRVHVNGEEMEIMPHWEVKKIYSRRHNKMVSLVGCKCGELNATPTPPEQLQKILHAHAGKTVSNDFQILRAPSTT